MSEYFKDTLPNGLRVVTVEMPHLHSVEMACYVGVGSRHEAGSQAGISHFLEHMLFRGTDDYPTSSELERAFEQIGGAVNASTDAEATCYHSRIHPDHLAQGANLFASMLRRPLLSGLEVERQIILEEALEDLNEAGEEISTDNLTSALLWPGHPLGVPTIGNRETVDRISLEDLQAHHRLFYAPGNTVLAVGGRVERGRVLAAASAAFGAWSQKAALPASGLPVEVPAHYPRSSWVRDFGAQVSLQLAFHVPGRGSSAAVPLRVLRALLSWGGASRLMLRLREELGLLYSAETAVSLYGDCGCFTVEMAVAPEKLCQAVEETSEVFRRLRRELVPAGELAAAVQAHLYDLEFSCDYADSMSMRYGWGELVGYPRTVEQDRREIAAVTAADVQQTARELFVPQRLAAAFVGSYREGDRPEVERLLQGFGAL